MIGEKGVLFAALIIYFLVLLGIGYAASRRRQAGVGDYYLGGRDLGPFMMIMTIAASWFSVSGFIGIPAFAYLAGPNFLVYGTWNILIALLIWYVGVRAWLIGHRFNYVTPTEMYADYYGGRTVPLLVIAIFLLAIIPQALVQLTGAGQAVLGLAGIPYWVGVLLFVAVVGVYTIFGGLRAVVWADVFQGTFMMAVGLFMPIALIILGGGPHAVFSKIAATDHSALTFDNSSLGESVSQYVQTGFGFLGMPYIFQRFFMARSPKVIGQSFMGAATIQVWIFATTSVVFGIAAHAFYTPHALGADPDVLVTKFFADYYPVIGAIVIAAVFAHGNSVISAIMLTGSSIFSVDLYKRYFATESTEQGTKRAGQGFIVVYMIVLIVVALVGAGGALVTVLTAIGFGLSLQVLPAMMGPLFWPRITTAGAASGMFVGLVGAILLQADSHLVPFGLYPGTVVLPFNLLVTVVVSLLTKPVPYSVQESFHGYLESHLYQASLSVRAL